MFECREITVRQLPLFKNFHDALLIRNWNQTLPVNKLIGSDSGLVRQGLTTVAVPRNSVLSGVAGTLCRGYKSDVGP